MGLGTTRSVALVGMAGHGVEVQAHVAASVPGFILVGLPDAALYESRDRIRAAVSSTGIPWPQRKITVNLSPASLPKTGTGFDLAIAMAILAGAGIIPADIRNVVHLAEVGLDGRLHPVRGVLPAVAEAVRGGVHDVIVAAADVDEARLVPGVRVRGAATLSEVLVLHGADVPIPNVAAVPRALPPATPAAHGDLVDVIGQDDARRALEVAAAGGHHLLMVGPPGAGKTMLASRLPGLLPELDDEAAIEVTSVHSVAGAFDPGHGLIRRPPFENPHHTATPASIVGGGSGIPRPGAASRAHRGVLFMDEAPEFSSRVLQTLRQPLEQGELVIHRARGVARFPAQFQLILAANPCPCGRRVGRGLDCTCRPLDVQRYLGRLSGPLLDRVDVQVDVLPVRHTRGGQGEPTAVVAERVADARSAAAGRLHGMGLRTNSEVPGAALRARFPLGPRTAVLDRAVERGALSLRGADRALRIAWTLADLAGRESPSRDDVGEALALRTRGNGG